MARALHLVFAVGLAGSLAAARLPEPAARIELTLENTHSASQGEASEDRVRKAGLLTLLGAAGLAVPYDGGRRQPWCE